ncbi:histidine kinase dimerization/phosphoacceptor domain -containing protein [Arenibacter sp. GZD96]|uniref:sensor histidine kinase n=1 Tax=Aurantibrevibacter litoralis TaxID=3106030 RepID=UPI002AFE8A6A|nr:histidine kinase dimerization/phosphoacceptor domain -containing protein [Arenibacter sp. GZD-96]MEA1785015.1 histidine kinase dimerization/phosphoacceptor domain -containing protein [Arenibacter sp. GZD-96]
MYTPPKDHEQWQDKVRLLQKVNYATAIFALLFGLMAIFALHIYDVIPHVFILFAFLSILNTFLFKWHQNLRLTYNITSLLAIIAAVIITLYSGGITSPFIFVLALIVLAGYVSTPTLGKVYLYASLAMVTLIYAQHWVPLQFTYNVVPEASGELFSFLSVLFTIYLLGGIFGKHVMKIQRKLYKSKNELEGRIVEKEMLLKEIHHRVKNNLQTVSSLLSLQSRNTEDIHVKNLFKSSQNRVISMAMVHEMLYMREDLTGIEYDSYVKELSEYLVRSVKGVENNVTLHIDIKDIRLGIDTAIPLGLLINETITNSLKYGITGDNSGEIHIALKKGEAQEYVLNIGDNGIGCPEVVNYKTSKSLGLKLIHNLARQLKGSITRDFSAKGTNYIVRFEEIGQQLHSFT